MEKITNCNDFEDQDKITKKGDLQDQIMILKIIFTEKLYKV